MPRTGATPINSNDELNSRNLALNGNMKLSQRGSSLVGTGGFQYLLDRNVGWFPNVGSVTSPTLAQSSLPAAFPGVENQADGRAFRMHGTINSLSPSPSFNRQQRIEAIRFKRIKSNLISVGFWGWANNMQNVYIQVLEPTGGGDDNYASSAVIADSGALPINDSGWKFFKLENIPIPDAKNGLEIRTTFADPSGTVFTDTYLTELMVNEGSFVKPFKLMGADAQEELTLCQRYFEVVHTRFRAALASGSIESTFSFKEDKRNESYVTNIIAGSVTVARSKIGSVTFANTTAASGNVQANVDAEL